MGVSGIVRGLRGIEVTWRDRLWGGGRYEGRPRAWVVILGVRRGRRAISLRREGVVWRSSYRIRTYQ